MSNQYFCSPTFTDDELVSSPTLTDNEFVSSPTFTDGDEMLLATLQPVKMEEEELDDIDAGYPYCVLYQIVIRCHNDENADTFTGHVCYSCYLRDKNYHYYKYIWQQGVGDEKEVKLLKEGKIENVNCDECDAPLYKLITQEEFAACRAVEHLLMNESYYLDSPHRLAPMKKPAAKKDRLHVKQRRLRFEDM